MAGKYLSLLVHFTWSTAGREPWIEPSMRPNLYSYIGGIMHNKNARLISAGGISDHIHLLASMPSTISVADFVNVVKSNSSKWIHENFSRLRSFAWQEGYGAFSVSKSDELRVIRYINNQAQHHQKRTFKQELVALLQKHGIEYRRAVSMELSCCRRHSCRTFGALKVFVDIDPRPRSGPKGRKLIATPVRAWINVPRIIWSAAGAKQCRPFGPYGCAASEASLTWHL